MSESDGNVFEPSAKQFCEQSYTPKCFPVKCQMDLEMLLDFVSTLNGSCCFKMQYKINEFLKSLTGCEIAFMVYLPKESTDAVIQVIGDKVLPEPCVISVPSLEAIPTFIKGEGDFSLEKLLVSAMSKYLSPFPTSLAKFPIYDQENENTISLIVCLANCKELPQCLEAVQQSLRVSAGVLLAAFHLYEERQRKDQCQKLLQMAKNLFLHLGDLVDLMQEITHEARDLTGAERCSLFLVSENGTELVAKVFDGVSSEQTEEVRVSIAQGVVGHVATSGQILNIRDAYDHPLFYRKFDEITGFRTKSMLVFPIRDGQDRIVGVAEMCNKKNGGYFTKLDEEAATALATYCGISLMHSLVYKKIQQSQARVRLVNELLMYHIGVTEETVTQVIDCRRPHDLASLQDWRWACRDAPLECTPCLSLSMLDSMGFLTSCRMDRATVVRFILQVRKGYRAVPYHNWYHAFSVAQFTFCVMKQLDLIGKSWITNLEAVALLVAALCHDLDHRGTTNSFQTKSKNTLACLYSSEGSVMEHHHLAQALNILNTEGCNIFENLDTASYRRVLELIRDLILATDLASHLTHLPQQRTVAEAFDPTSQDHRRHLLSLMITCADLSDQVKGWQYSRNIAGRVYDEFFAQGDLERKMGSEPAIMMDRTKADIPVLQVQFLEEICLPCFQLLARFFPTLDGCGTSVEDNLKRWALAQDWFTLPENKNRSALDLLNDHKLQVYVYQ